VVEIVLHCIQQLKSESSFFFNLANVNKRLSFTYSPKPKPIFPPKMLHFLIQIVCHKKYNQQGEAVKADVFYL
jgi:hypothetical protein